MLGTHYYFTNTCCVKSISLLGEPRENNKEKTSAGNMGIFVRREIPNGQVNTKGRKQDNVKNRYLFSKY